MKYLLLIPLLLSSGCSVITATANLGQKKEEVLFALAEGGLPAICETDDSLPVSATVKDGNATRKINGYYNCKGLVFIPATLYTYMRSKAFPQEPLTITMAAFALGDATITETRVIIEAGDPIYIDTDAMLDVTFCPKSAGKRGKQNCAGMVGLKESIYMDLRAKAGLDKPEVKP
jgi:hypothetical protein